MTKSAISHFISPSRMGFCDHSYPAPPPFNKKEIPFAPETDRRIARLEDDEGRAAARGRGAESMSRPGAALGELLVAELGLPLPLVGAHGLAPDHVRAAIERPGLALEAALAIGIDFLLLQRRI